MTPTGKARSDADDPTPPVTGPCSPGCGLGCLCRAADDAEPDLAAIVRELEALLAKATPGPWREARAERAERALEIVSGIVAQPEQIPLDPADELAGSMFPDDESARAAAERAIVERDAQHAPRTARRTREFAAALRRAFDEADEAKAAHVRAERERDEAQRKVEAQRAIVVRVHEERVAARAELAAVLREAERLRHGAPVEGDFVCPNALRADAAEKEAERLRKGIGQARNAAVWAASALSCQTGDGFVREGVNRTIDILDAALAGEERAR